MHFDFPIADSQLIADTRTMGGETTISQTRIPGKSPFFEWRLNFNSTFSEWEIQIVSPFSHHFVTKNGD